MTASDVQVGSARAHQPRQTLPLISDYGLGALVSRPSAASALPPSDADIRAVLLEHLRQRHGNDATVAFVEELGLCRGQVRVDVAVVNGSIHGYEIKSDRDSLRRLARQAAVYGLVLDRATLVVGSKHAAEAAEAVPAWWEVQIVVPNGSGLRVKRLRRGSENPARSARALVELLWLEDAQALLADRGALRGFRGRPRREVWDRVCALYGLDEIASAVRVQLKARTEQRSARPRA